MVMHMFMNQIHFQQQIFIPQDLFGNTDLPDPVVLRHDRNGRLQLADEGKVMGAHHDGLARIAQLEKSAP